MEQLGGTLGEGEGGKNKARFKNGKNSPRLNRGEKKLKGFVAFSYSSVS